MNRLYTKYWAWNCKFEGKNGKVSVLTAQPRAPLLEFLGASYQSDVLQAAAAERLEL